MMDKFYMVIALIVVGAISLLVNYGLALAGHPSSVWLMRALGVM